MCGLHTESPLFRARLSIESKSESHAQTPSWFRLVNKVAITSHANRDTHVPFGARARGVCGHFGDRAILLFTCSIGFGGGGNTLTRVAKSGSASTLRVEEEHRFALRSGFVYGCCVFMCKVRAALSWMVLNRRWLAPMLMRCWCLFIYRLHGNYEWWIVCRLRWMKAKKFSYFWGNLQ